MMLILYFCYFQIFAASSSNTFTKTFTGIDGAGKRLADEVSCNPFKYVFLETVSYLDLRYTSSLKGTCNFINIQQ